MPWDTMRGPRPPKLLLHALALLALLAPAASADELAASCLRIQRVTAFAPRGQVYVEVQAACAPRQFEDEDPILAYLELLVRDQGAVGEDVRIYSDQPSRVLTFEFRDLDLIKGDPVLVRLVRFGEILGLETIVVP